MDGDSFSESDYDLLSMSDFSHSSASNESEDVCHDAVPHEKPSEIVRDPTTRSDGNTDDSQVTSTLHNVPTGNAHNKRKGLIFLVVATLFLTAKNVSPDILLQPPKKMPVILHCITPRFRIRAGHVRPRKLIDMGVVPFMPYTYPLNKTNTCKTKRDPLKGIIAHRINKDTDGRAVLHVDVTLKELIRRVGLIAMVHIKHSIIKMLHMVRQYLANLTKGVMHIIRRSTTRRKKPLNTRS